MKLEVHFMPWAALKKPVSVGPVKFWPMTNLRSLIDDDAAFDYLGRYFSSYVDHHGRPVETITICTHGDDKIRQFTKQEAIDIHDAVAALVFATIAPAGRRGVVMDNASWAPPSADIFLQYVQALDTEKESFTVCVGSLTSGGHKIGSPLFHAPWSSGGSFGCLDLTLLSALGEILVPGVAAESRNRIVRSLDWFRLAHIEAETTSTLSKVVMMNTAFEILLNIPNEHDKAGWFADCIAKECSSTDSIMETRKDKKGHDVSRRLTAWWAWDFYKSRNTIVHGDDYDPAQWIYPAPELDWITQLIVAEMVFMECMDVVLKSLGIKRFTLGYSDVHEALGWIPPRVRRSVTWTATAPA